MPSDEELMGHITEVQQRYVDDLMSKANVVGVGVGYVRQGNTYTDELCLVVMVERKMPIVALAENDIIPRELEGIRIDVQETGAFAAF